VIVHGCQIFLIGREGWSRHVRKFRCRGGVVFVGAILSSKFSGFILILFSLISLAIKCSLFELYINILNNMSKNAELKVDGKSYELPIVEGTEGEKALDISALRNQSNYITLDPGFKNTGATKSAITFLDGEQGILRYRGYSIETLAEKSTFLEVAYLLIYGNLPKKEEFEAFSKRITNHTLVHEDIKNILDGFPSKAHP